jgi:hypothetical protein
MSDEKHAVRQWFHEWAMRHMQRCAKPGWPTVGDSTEHFNTFFEPWIEAFIRAGVTENAADYASVEMAMHPYPYPGGEHLTMFMKYIPGAFHRINAERLGLAAGSREECELRSRDCPECSGQGMTNRFMIRNDMRYSFAMFCMCPAGEWMAQHHFTTNKDTYNRFRRLAQYPELWDAELQYAAWPLEPAPRGWPLERWLAPIASNRVPTVTPSTGYVRPPYQIFPS